MALSDDVLQVLEEIKALPKEEKKKLDAEVYDQCNNRESCLRYGIDYSDITTKDIQKLTVNIYLERKRLEEKLKKQ